MGNSLKKLCNSIRIRSTCVSTCCSDNTKQEVFVGAQPLQVVPIVADTACRGYASTNTAVVLSPIASKEINFSKAMEHSHHIEHHEHIENIGGGIILHTIEDKIICDS